MSGSVVVDGSTALIMMASSNRLGFTETIPGSIEKFTFVDSDADSEYGVILTFSSCWRVKRGE